MGENSSYRIWGMPDFWLPPSTVRSVRIGLSNLWGKREECGVVCCGKCGVWRGLRVGEVGGDGGGGGDCGGGEGCAE